MLSILHAAGALTTSNPNVSFGSTRDSPRDITLNRAGKPLPVADLRRRDFLVRFCQTAGAALIPTRLWGVSLPGSNFLPSRTEPDAGYQLQLHYRSERPLDATLLKVQAGLDDFITEKYADQIAKILAEWSAGLLQSPRQTQAIAKVLAAGFAGASLEPTESRVVRAGSSLQVHQNKFSTQPTLNRDNFLREWPSTLSVFSRIITAEFQVIGIDAASAKSAASSSATKFPARVQTRVRYEIVGSGANFYREQRIGSWNMMWEPSSSGEFHLRSWRALDETQARTSSPVYVDITSAALASSSSYAAQLLHGTDYWRTLLDGASGIDIYGHNGVSVADIDNDGFDDLYVCQPAGLPNRLYRNRGDGTFEDITESSGLGIVENTACALFADFNNDGRQDVIVVRANGPLLFLNEGGGKFRQKPEAFQFANPPQGTFTGAAAADYDRDGWLDVYFCLYSYYQGTGQYKYPSPYHDAENGPPNFLVRNQRDGTFRDVTAESGLNQNNTRYSFCCGWSDYNHDGWPDLYVVNDFGRKNLYRNNGDGTFTDVAPQAAVEDVGAGMSVSWFDYDNDGAEDLYVGNMWTAAGLARFDAGNLQERLVQGSPVALSKTRDGQFLAPEYARNMLRNTLPTRVDAFEDTTKSAGVGMGRWAWSSDAFDFDHDGFPDLYIANGMVSGPLRADVSREDLNSFFWRQVVAYSPDDARASRDYEQGWNAINELIRSDGSWSGYERNVFYANNRDGTFSDVSGVVGLDFVQDGRAFALADFDHDGRLELFLKNRNAPQLRILKNVVEDLPPSIAFRLQGTKSNRDAIGASVTTETAEGRQTRTLQAGSGFLSQHSKEIFFGLGDEKGPVRASIRWPSGLVQELHNLPINHRFWVKEGDDSLRNEPFKTQATNRTPVRARPPKKPNRFHPKLKPGFSRPLPLPTSNFPICQGRSRRCPQRAANLCF